MCYLLLSEPVAHCQDIAGHGADGLGIRLYTPASNHHAGLNTVLVYIQSRTTLIHYLHRNPLVPARTGRRLEDISFFSACSQVPTQATFGDKRWFKEASGSDFCADSQVPPNKTTSAHPSMVLAS